MEAGLEQILTPDEILQKGLELVGFSRRRQQNVACGTPDESGTAQGALRVDEGKHTTMAPFDLYC